MTPVQKQVELVRVEVGKVLATLMQAPAPKGQQVIIHPVSFYQSGKRHGSKLQTGAAYRTKPQSGAWPSCKSGGFLG
jgi:hypothetical protein